MNFYYILTYMTLWYIGIITYLLFDNFNSSTQPRYLPRPSPSSRHNHNQPQEEEAGAVGDDDGPGRVEPELAELVGLGKVPVLPVAGLDHHQRGEGRDELVVEGQVEGALQVITDLSEYVM